jgi:hypothetical protein
MPLSFCELLRVRASLLPLRQATGEGADGVEAPGRVAPAGGGPLALLAQQDQPARDVADDLDVAPLRRARALALRLTNPVDLVVLVAYFGNDEVAPGGENDQFDGGDRLGDGRRQHAHRARLVVVGVGEMLCGLLQDRWRGDERPSPLGSVERLREDGCPAVEAARGVVDEEAEMEGRLFAGHRRQRLFLRRQHDSPDPELLELDHADGRKGIVAALDDLLG